MSLSQLTKVMKHNRTFEEWLKAVDVCLAERIGLGHDDLPDCCYRDWYEDGISPSRAAGRAMRAANGY